MNQTTAAAMIIATTLISLFFAFFARRFGTGLSTRVVIVVRVLCDVVIAFKQMQLVTEVSW
jgi:hypothetical protein